MTITTISYSQSKETVYSFGLKKWNKVGIDIAIDEKDDTQKVFEFAKETVENWLKEDVQQPVAQMDEPVVQLDNKPNPTESMIEEMEACTTYDDIFSFRFTLKNDEQKAIYERKLSELSPKNQ